MLGLISMDSRPRGNDGGGAPLNRQLRECGVPCLFCIYAFKPTPLRWVGLLNNPHRKKKTHAAQCMGFTTNTLNIVSSSFANLASLQ
jgi:hypothetical protein